MTTTVAPRQFLLLIAVVDMEKTFFMLTAADSRGTAAESKRAPQVGRHGPPRWRCDPGQGRRAPDARRGIGIKLYIRCGDAVALQSLTDEPDND